MGSKQIPGEKPDIVKALTTISGRLESLSNEIEEKRYLKTTRCVVFIEDALRGNYEIDFDDIMREVKFSVPGFDLEKKCGQIFLIAKSVDDKIESGEAPLREDFKWLRFRLRQLVDDIDFVCKKLR